MQFGPPVLATAVSGIDAAGPHYRGKDVAALVRQGHSFEAVAELLWTGTLPEHAAWASGDAARTITELSASLPAARDLSTLMVAAALMANHVEEPRRLVRIFAALAGKGAKRRALAAARPRIADVLATSLGVRGGDVVRALDVALVVTADHELNASTFAARVVASTGASLHAAVAGALGALTGSKHGGATERVESLLDGSVKVERDEAVPGFGHPLYPDGDPRAVLLLETASQVAGSRAALAPCFALVRSMERAGRDAPNLDFGLVALGRALGLPRGSAALVFAVARTAGWVAHALEQRASGQLLRPRARYTGTRDTT